MKNEFTVPKDGQYQLETHDPARREIRILINGVLLNDASSAVPHDRAAEIKIVPRLLRGTVITTEPADAPLLIVSMPDATVVYDTTSRAA